MKRSERGVIAVEFALILPVLALIIFAVFHFGFQYQQAAMANNAAMVGVRHMTIHNSFADAESAARGALDSEAGPIASISVNPGSCSTDADVTVVVTVTRDAPPPAMFGDTFTVSGKAVARCTE